MRTLGGRITRVQRHSKPSSLPVRRATGARYANRANGHHQTLRVLVTGGVGFVGGHLVQRLISDGCQSITVLDNLSRGLFDNIARDSESIRFFHADIRDEHAVARVMENIDLVFHLAAQSSIIRALQDIDYLSST